MKSLELELEHFQHEKNEKYNDEKKHEKDENESWNSDDWQCKWRILLHSDDSAI